MIQESKTIERRGLAKGLKVWVDILFYLSLVGAVIWIAVLPISMLTDQIGDDLRIPVNIEERSLPPVVSSPVRLASAADPEITLTKARGELHFDSVGLWPSLMYWILSLVLFAALVSGLLLLRRILASTIAGYPFDPENPRRLNRLGWILVVTSLLVPVCQFFFSAWALNQVGTGGIIISATPDFSEEWIVGGLLVLVLAAIWKEAVRLAEDQSLTV